MDAPGAPMMSILDQIHRSLTGFLRGLGVSVAPWLEFALRFLCLLRSSVLKAVVCVVAFTVLPVAASAHVGSPDVYYDGHAGPYHLLVTIRPPTVVPGVAEIQIRCVSNDVNQIQILPLRMVGVASRLAPKPDTAERSGSDPQLFTGGLWLLVRGAWKVQINVDGQHGKAELPCLSLRSPPLQRVCRRPWADCSLFSACC